jgi:hypothetical protein
VRSGPRLGIAAGPETARGPGPTVRARALGLGTLAGGQEDQMAMICASSMPTGDFPNRVDCPPDKSPKTTNH